MEVKCSSFPPYLHRQAQLWQNHSIVTIDVAEWDVVGFVMLNV